MNSNTTSIDDMFDLSQFDVGSLLDQLRKDKKALSIPMLKEEFRAKLVQEADTLQYAQRPESAGPYLVRQRFDGQEGEYPPNSNFMRLVAEFEKLFRNEIAKLPEQPFKSPLTFNDVSLQRYAKGKLGVSAHKDNSRFVNIICLFMIEGRARFCVCSDRDGANTVEIPSDPGRLLLLKAPGLYGQHEQPWHFVEDVEGKRYSFTLRQNTELAMAAGYIRDN